jgi:DNA-directed RNA polymerase specialized sigma24 family protein
MIQEQKEMDPPEILRECLRHYLEFQWFVSQTGKDVIEHKGFRISFLDLQYGIGELSARKKEALFHNVILDKTQAEVAEIMGGIQTVTVGQYVKAACTQLAKRYFSPEELGHEG